MGGTIFSVPAKHLAAFPARLSFSLPGTVVQKQIHLPVLLGLSVLPSELHIFSCALGLQNALPLACARRADRSVRERIHVRSNRIPTAVRMAWLRQWTTPSLHHMS